MEGRPLEGEDGFGEAEGLKPPEAEPKLLPFEEY